MGAALLDVASTRGLRVLGLERHVSIAHGYARSHASSRGFRQTYVDETWREWASNSRDYWIGLGEGIFEPTGATLTAPVDHPMLKGVRRAARSLGVVCETFPYGMQERVFPGLSAQFETIFEPDAGWIRAQDAVVAMCARARRHGAQIRCGARVLRVHCDSEAHIEVELASGERLRARSVALCTAGHEVPVSGQARPHTPLIFRRQVEHWLDVSEAVLCDRRGIQMFHLLDLPFRGGERVHMYGMFEAPGVLKCCVQRERLDVREELPIFFRPVRQEEVDGVLEVCEEVWPGCSGVVRYIDSRLGWNVETSTSQFFLQGLELDVPRLIHAQAFCGHGFKMFPAIARDLCDRLG